MPECIYLVRMSLRATALFALGKAQGLPIRQADEGYLTHAALRALFGEFAPQPFAVETGVDEAAERNWGSRREAGVWRVLAYARADERALVGHARAFADPLAFRACDMSGLASKLMPERFPAGTRLDFEVRTCPIVRKASAGERHREGAEVDAFLARCWQVGEGVPVDREATYLDWLRAQLSRGGAASLEVGRLVRFRRAILLRRTQGERRRGEGCERPDALLAGTLRVDDADAFAALLARGLGRHRAFGFGMLLLRPPARRSTGAGG